MTGSAGSKPAAPTTKPRTLTPSQRERKRAADRKSHRQSRAKTKNYVAHLERLLQDTTSSAGGDTDRTSKLLNRLNQNFTRINQLAESLASIREIAQSALDDVGNELSHDTVSATPNNNTADDNQAAQSHGIEASADGTSPSVTWPSLDFLDLEAFDLAVNRLSQPASLPQPPSPNIADFDASLSLFDVPAMYKNQLTQPSLPCMHSSTDSKVIWTEVAKFTSNALQSSYASDLARDVDMLVMAVMHGWDHVPSEYRLDTTWQVLEHCDQHFSNYGAAGRLAILYLMRLQLHHIRTGEYLHGTPSFMRARPSQKFINHLPNVEFYTWPGFREYLLFWPDKYSSDMSLSTLRSHFRFLWPHSPQDSYIWDSSRGGYSLSEELLRRISDIRCWTVHSDFFEQFPELRGDIPAFSSIPSNISTNFRIPTQTQAGLIEEYDQKDGDRHARKGRLSHSPVPGDLALCLFDAGTTSLHQA
ncbi:hypothetical protein FQN57_001662 [Myotisia sp. PD_48]|nr:hypothetical protein FQN57_001662 [Myotisia sp. PD_48]